ncbi:MAG: TonB-dependent receptor, partial [Gammaproteobacteria bacterium]|nr:TonB-dependent receptor [Gammaproteobacteria bacterium]
ALDLNNYPNPLPNSVTRDSMPKVSEATGESRQLTRATLNVDWDVGFGAFSFLSGYSYTEQSSVSDFSRSSGNALPFLYCQNAQTAAAPANCPGSPGTLVFVRTPMGFIDREHGSEVEEFSQEIRFTSPTDEPLRYTGGLYYFRDKSKSFPGGIVATALLPEPLANIGLGAVPGGTALAIGSYIFGPGFMPNGTIDPMKRVIGTGDVESWSVFGAVDYDVTEAWQARGEIRLTEESQEDSSNIYNNLCTSPLYYQPNPNGDPPNRDTQTPTEYNNAIVTANPYNPASNFPYNQAPAADCGDAYWNLNTPNQSWQYAKDAEGYYIPGQFASGTTTRSGSARFETVTGRLSLKYQFESGWIGYGSVAWGQKPGGLQLLSAEVVTPSGTAQEQFTNAYDPEKITAYELGVKGFSSDRRIGVDLSMFYNDWTAIVLRQLTETSPASGLAFTQPVSLNTNGGDAKVWGWEMSNDFSFTENLSGRLTAAWTDSQLTNARQDTFSLFPSLYTTEPSCTPAAIQAIVGADAGDTAKQQEIKGLQCQALSGNVSGNTQMRQPEWTASASLSYGRQLRGEWDWYARTDANYTDKIYVGNDNQAWLPARTIANLRFGLKSPTYTVEFWVRNLFDNDDPTAAFRDIYWTNTSDITASEAPTHSNFDDFPPLRYSISYPKLRTFGVLARMRFGAAVQ